MCDAKPVGTLMRESMKGSRHRAELECLELRARIGQLEERWSKLRSKLRKLMVDQRICPPVWQWLVNRIVAHILKTMDDLEGAGK